MDFSFPALLALAFLHGDGLLLRQTLTVCLLHELGHGIAMCLTGAGIREVTLYAAGVRMRTRLPFLSKWRELLILYSGPAANFMAAALLYWIGGMCDAVYLHLCMGCFNLLPYAVLDGGSALQCLFAENRLLLRMQTVLCLLLSMGMLVFFIYRHIPNPFLYLMCVYLAAAQLRVDKQGGMW